MRRTRRSLRSATGATRPLIAVVLVAAALGTACHAGSIREELGQQLRRINSRLRGASPRERYTDELRGAGAAGEAAARAWLAAGDHALDMPAAAPLPLREQGAFAGAEPLAVAWRIHPRRGEQVTVRVDAQADSGAQLFTELWREKTGDSTARQLVASSDSLHATYAILVDDADAAYVLRVQPALGRPVRWAVAFGAGPSLAFPVQGKDVRAIESGFGVARDGGARTHEGVDIMAPRGTPALAAEDGLVRYVGDDRLGGHVVSVDALTRGHSLYYAHLDRQAVHEGQLVHSGDTLGFVGNTGNARGGPTHLHFGIYTPSSGAVDPRPYLDDRHTAVRAPGRDTALIGDLVRTTARSAVPLRAGPGGGAATLTPLTPRTVLMVDAVAGGDWLHVHMAATTSAPSGYVLADAVERVPGGREPGIAAENATRGGAGH